MHTTDLHTCSIGELGISQVAGRLQGDKQVKGDAAKYAGIAEGCGEGLILATDWELSRLGEGCHLIQHSRSFACTGLDLPARLKHYAVHSIA